MAENRYFTGEFEHTIDSVNRLTIPAKWRTGESEELFMFAREGRIAVLPRNEVEKIVQQIESATDMSAVEKRERRQSMFHSAVQATCDKQGRVTLDVKLLKHAGLRDSVMLVGGGVNFEMWSPKSWAERKRKLDDVRNDTMDRFGI